MKKLLFILPALLFIAGLSVSQNKFNVNFYGGYTLPVSDLRGDFPDTLGNSLLNFRKSKTLLTKNGFNIGIQGKYTVDSSGRQRITAGINYNSFSGSMDYPGLGGNVLTYKNRVTIFTLSAGIEYAVNPAKKFVPHFGLDLAANFFGGKIEASGDTVFTIKRKSESRFGVIVNGGIDIKLWKSGGLTAGVRYALCNLLGKTSEITTTPAVIADAEEQGTSSGSELPLNDEAVSGIPEKIINYVQFYLGLSFNFGEKTGKK